MVSDITAWKKCWAWAGWSPEQLARMSLADFVHIRRRAYPYWVSEKVMIVPGNLVSGEVQLKMERWLGSLQVSDELVA